MSNFSPEEVTRFHAFFSQLAASSASLAGSSTQPLAQASQAIAYPLPSLQVTGPSIPIPSTYAPAPSHLVPSALSQIQGPGIPLITQLYQGSQVQQGHPAPRASQPPSFNPFIGTGLSLPNTSLANQARLASASSTLPRQPLLSRRGCRRGVAPQAPALPRLAAISIQNCIIDDGAILTVRVVVRVFPPVVRVSFFLKFSDRLIYF